MHRYQLLASALWQRTVGEPDAGNLHVRFDEGEGDMRGMVCRLFATKPERADTSEACDLNNSCLPLYSTVFLVKEGLSFPANLLIIMHAA